MMARMKKGREEREKVKAMHTRGIPGTANDEGMQHPLNFQTNQAYKGAFSTFSHNPDHIIVNQNMNQTYQSNQI